MNKLITLLVCMLVYSLGLQAQEFQGMAVYESKTSMAEFKANRPENKNVTPEMEKNFDERMKKMFEKTFILNFDKTASIYKEEEKLDTPGQDGGGGRMDMMASMNGSGGTYYKDVKSKTYTIDKEFMSKDFLIKDSLPNLQWKLEGETRIIGGYNCFKATAVVPISKTDFRNFGPKREEDKKEEIPEADAKGKTTNLLSEIEAPKFSIITAWYTPEIPVNQGPEKYWGLPGLILEVNDGQTTILCSKIILNPKNKAVIIASRKGKVISQKDYDELVIKKMKEFRERNSGQGDKGGPGGPPPGH
jgi:GLPGLI family protein